MSNSDDNYIGVMLEEIRDQNKAVLEGVSGIQQRLTSVEEKINNLPTREEFDVVRAAVTSTSKQVSDHEKQITQFRVRRA